MDGDGGVGTLAGGQPQFALARAVEVDIGGATGAETAARDVGSVEVHPVQIVAVCKCKYQLVIHCESG